MTNKRNVFLPLLLCLALLIGLTGCGIGEDPQKTTVALDLILTPLSLDPKG